MADVEEAAVLTLGHGAPQKVTASPNTPRTWLVACGNLDIAGAGVARTKSELGIWHPHQFSGIIAPTVTARQRMLGATGRSISLSHVTQVEARAVSWTCVQHHAAALPRQTVWRWWH